MWFTAPGRPKLAADCSLEDRAERSHDGRPRTKAWLSEARCGSRVRHPNVVQVHDAADVDGWLYLVLEFVPGGSLKARLRGPVPPRSAAELMTQVAAAISAGHRAGLLHLDLKPSNILLDSALGAMWKDAHPKVADFGIARPLAALDESSTNLAGPWGTPSYMAPEQATASRDGVGPAADIHALGAILYELLTGRPPFQGASMLETLDQVRSQNPVSPRRMNPKIPRDLETIALKCLEKNPSRRYASAEALASDLSRWLDGHPINARPVSPLEHAWRWCYRQPAIAALAVTLFLTVIGSFFGLITLQRSSEAHRTLSGEYYQVASRSLAELSATALRGGEHSVGFFSDNHFRTLELARSLEFELAKQYSPDCSGLKRLAVIDTHLANFYARDRNYEHCAIAQGGIDPLWPGVPVHCVPMMWQSRNSMRSIQRLEFCIYNRLQRQPAL